MRTASRRSVIPAPQWIRSEIPFRLNASSPQADGLVGWWPTVGYRGGNLRDYVAGNDAVLVGNVDTIVDSEYGRMLAFRNIANQYFSVADCPALQISGDMSVAFWLRPRWGETDANAIVNKGEWHQWYSDVTQWCWQKVPVAGTIDFIVGDGSETWYPQDTASGPLVNTGNLYHIVGIHDAGVALSIYVNGVVDDNTYPACPGPLHLNAEPMLIGKSADGTLWGNADIADIRVYNRALTAAEVARMYAPTTRWELYDPRPYKPDPPLRVFWDTFTDVDTTLLSEHTPDVGTVWAGANANWTISSNMAVTAAPNNVVVRDTGMDDYRVTVISRVTANDFGDKFPNGAVVRSNNFNRFFTVGIIHDAFIISENNAGTITKRATTAVTINPNTSYAISVVCSGGTITATLDGANQISYDSAPATEARYAGIRVIWPGGAVDDFAIWSL